MVLRPMIKTGNMKMYLLAITGLFLFVEILSYQQVDETRRNQVTPS